MLDVSLKPELRQLEKSLAKLAKWGRDLTPVFKAARRPVMRDQAEHRKKAEGPDGKWPARSPFTMERAKARARAKGKKRSGRLLGKLPSALKLTIDRQRLRVESRVKWSNVHQEGAGRTGKAPKIPERRFLWVSAKLVKEIVAIVVKSAQRSWP